MYGEGSMCARISRAVCCKMDVISKFPVYAKDCWKIFFPRSWACNFWMMGVICDTFLANAFVNASLVFLSLTRLECYRVRGGDDCEEGLRGGVGEVGKARWRWIGIWSVTPAGRESRSTSHFWMRGT